VRLAQVSMHWAYHPNVFCVFCPPTALPLFHGIMCWQNWRYCRYRVEWS